jgi:hypothetical protein
VARALERSRPCRHDGWAEQPELSRRNAVDLARRALEATQNDDPGVLANVSFILANFGEDIGAMIGLIDRALALNPSFARGWNISGLPDEASCAAFLPLDAVLPIIAKSAFEKRPVTRKPDILLI